jgi:ATP-dependent protease ClpP protease subunit
MMGDRSMPDMRQRFQALLRPDQQPQRNTPRALIEMRQDPAGQVAIIRLYDPIDSWGGMWGVSAKEVADALDDLPVGVTEIRVLINSPGGEVFEAIAVMNLLRAHPARVVTVVQGLAASMASCIAISGDEVVMAPNSELMIHDAWGLCVGNAAEMRTMADELDHFSDNLASVYAAKAGGSKPDWRAVMSGEQWYSAEEAVAAGLADRVGQVEDPAGAQDVPDADDAPDAVDVNVDTPPMGSWDLSRLFTYAGRAKAPAPHTPAATAGGSTPPEGSPAVAFSDEQLTTLRQRLGVSDDADEATILAALDEALIERADPPAAPNVPEGSVLVDATTFDELRAQAAQGVEARTEQLRAQREAQVTAAINDGRIAPARRDHWLAQLEQDPGASQVLASLAPGLIPVEARGADNAPEGDVHEDEAYARLFGAEKKGA